MKFIIILKIIIEISKLFFFISNNKDKKLQIKYKIKYKMNHQVYGIIIFAGIILLIYLLNYNYKLIDKKRNVSFNIEIE